MDVRLWKTLHVKENVATWGLSWSLIDICQSQWWVVSWIWITKPSTTFWSRNWACGQLDAASRLRSRSHCHLRERSFGRKEYSSGPAAPMLAWPECDFSLSRNSNSTSKVVILELWTTSKRSWQTNWGHFYIKTSSTTTVSGNVSGSVRLPKGTALKGMVIFSSAVNKKASVALLFRHNLYYFKFHVIHLPCSTVHWKSEFFNTSSTAFDTRY
jgi:hypothetical protein